MFLQGLICWVFLSQQIMAVLFQCQIQGFPVLGFKPLLFVMENCLQEVVKKSFDAIQVKVEFKIAKWPEQLKQSRAGKLMMWGVAWGGANPDGQYYLDLLYGPNKGQANHARFDLPAFNALYDATSAKLFGVSLRVLSNRAAAEDAMQDSFVKIWKNIFNMIKYKI